jgi:hypothetical protein
MIHHFANLISWKYLAQNNCQSCIVNIDSITLGILTTLFSNKRYPRNPGVRKVLMLLKNEEKYLWLTADNSKKFTYQIILPKNLDIGNCHELIQKCQLFNIEKIVIGISSPKQDQLAHLLEVNLRVTTEIYCLGAAVYNPIKEQSRVDKIGLYWIKMLIINPKRTIGKIIIIMKEICSILFINKNRQKFKTFILKFKM